MGIGGQASGDFKLSQGALRVLYSVIKNTISVLAADSFTQSNPQIQLTALAKSTTIPANVKKGVLGGSVAFTRPAVGATSVGGPPGTFASPIATGNIKPLGLFLNDSLGNAFENTPGPASGRGPFLQGGTVGVKVYETQQLTTTGGGSVGDALTAYANGQHLYASCNGFLTNRWQDSYEALAGASTEPACTRMGVVLAPPDATNAELFCTLRLL